MPKNIAIVESPAKAKTIAKFLGADFEVESSYGHVRDLPKKEMGIDIEHNFEPKYIIPDDKKKVIRLLKSKVKDAETVWLATDEDREGEAIAWHLAKALGVDTTKAKRIVFHEITESAIKKAIENPRLIKEDLVCAQQARRVLDRLVGYELSPVLWRKIQTGLSAGRVQSVAVRLLVEREEEIRAHKPKSIFRTFGVFVSDAQSFEAELNHKFLAAQPAEEFLGILPTATFTISSVDAKTAQKSPPPPFTTSSLQQTASNSLGYSVKRTMSLAQRLYESGLITYMRTDSVAMAADALNGAARHIKSAYGDNYYHRRQYATKSKLAQEAHEAIRPTDFSRTEISGDSAQAKLYSLIHRRALASQMSAAQIARTNVQIDISGSEHHFTAKGEVTVFDGFTKVYSDKQSQDRTLPNLKTGQALNLKEAVSTQTLSKPKPRYTEASLVRKLEQLGIGRPSTYAPTISTIQARGYVEKTPLEGVAHKITVLKLVEGKISRSEEEVKIGAAQNKLVPSEVGIVVSNFLVKHFKDVLDYKFTAKVEDQFDAIAQGSVKWQRMIADFYKPFHQDITKAADISRHDAIAMRELGKDPASGKPIFARIGRYGPMIQAGKTEDTEKPKFAPVPKGLRLDDITFEQALKLLDLPRLVGKTPDKEDIHAHIGRFGPYLKAGATSVSLKEDDPLTIDETRAQELVADKKKLDANKVIQEYKDSSLKVLNGPYGPYITDGKERRRVPKEVDPAKLTLETAQEIINQPKRYAGKKK